jgi:hypothetical protein
MVILVLGIISATVSGVIMFFTQLFLYSPRQLDTQKIAQELGNMMAEGNQDVRGMRFTRTVLDASATQFSYIYGYPTLAEGLSVRLRWSATDKKIYRSTSTNGGSSWSAESVIPAYLLNNTSLTLDGKDTSGVIFTYKKANNVDWVAGTDAVSTIRRAIINIKMQTATGAFANAQGLSAYTASVEIKGF